MANNKISDMEIVAVRAKLPGWWIERLERDYPSAIKIFPPPAAGDDGYVYSRTWDSAGRFWRVQNFPHSIEQISLMEAVDKLREKC